MRLPLRSFFIVAVVCLPLSWQATLGQTLSAAKAPVGPNGTSSILRTDGSPLASKAKELFDRGDYPGAEKIFRKIAARRPKNLHALSNLAVVLFWEGRTDQAEPWLKKAIALAPKDWVMHCTLGIVYDQQGKVDDAIHEFIRTLALNPRDATAQYFLRINASRKDWKEVAKNGSLAPDKFDPTFAIPPPGPDIDPKFAIPTVRPLPKSD